jgi:hypothetical protein
MLPGEMRTVVVTPGAVYPSGDAPSKEGRDPGIRGRLVSDRKRTASDRRQSAGTL